MTHGWRVTIAGAAAALLVATLGVVPASADPDNPSLAEREAWSAEERRAHGQRLRDDVEGEELLPSVADPAQTMEIDSPTITSAPAAIELPEPAVEALEVTPESDQEVEAVELPVTLSALTLESAQSVADQGQDDPTTQSPQDATDPPSTDSAATFEVAVGEATAALEAGVEGLLLEIAPTSDAARESSVEIEIDYSAFADTYGGDWASRLQLVALPACDAQAPGPECEQQTSLDSVNDPQRQVVHARIAPEAMGTMALTAGTEGSAGSWSATSLAPSAAWNVSEQTGTFSWSYPLRVPPAPGGPAPDLSLGYSSSTVDGRVASTNNQTSWIGEGWSMSEGYVERRYASCSEDAPGGNNASHPTGDLCWRNDNATLVFNGSAVELVKDATTGVWKPKQDDGSRVEKLTGGWGSSSGEYWKVTTADGVQYYFGRGKRSATDSLTLNSAWTVPVFGNHTGEPCYNASFAASSCEQVWRWNLDYVIDPSSNTMTYVYEKETNNYGRNLNTAVSTYTRGGYLARIDYGQRAGTESANSPARVEFTTAERCLPSGSVTCTPGELNASTASNWPDVPADLICTSSTTCVGQVSPAFFTRKRLTTITTKVWSGSAYRDVDSWTLGHQFPDPGDSTSKLLWLASIEHKGLVGTAIALPKVEFTGIQLANRVDESGSLGPKMNRYRISAIRSEAGGTLGIEYTPKDCTTSSLPASAETNTRRCFPVFWDPDGPIGPIQEYFHKYLVHQILEHPATTDSPAILTKYTYVGNPAWHYDDNELTKPQLRTWGEFRGYDTVDVSVGDVGTDQLKTRYRFFRGMDGDRLAPAGGTRSVSIDGITDREEFNGQTREVITYNGAAPVSSTRTTPWRSSPTATGADGTTARYTGIETNEALTYGSAFPGGVRTTRTVTTFDSYGMPSQVDDQGDIATTSDDRCYRTEYARNTSINMLDRVQRSEVVAKSCATTPSRPGDVISDERTSYDGASFSTAPTRGLASNTAQIASYSGSVPAYVTVSAATYDAHGRVVSLSDALGRTTTTAYTPTVDGLVSKMVVTSNDPDGGGPLTPHVTTTDLDPAWGLQTKVTDPNAKVTTGTYDALGRLTQVWLPGRVQGTHTPNTKLTYAVSATGENSVTTETLIHDGTYRLTTTLFDGLLRERQSQGPASDRGSTGRVVTGTTYDSRGLTVIRNSPWYTTGAVSTTAVIPTVAIPGRTVLTYDGAGRQTAQITQVGEIEQWRTTTSYDGNRTHTDPPVGGVPTTTINDVRGNPTQLLSYTGPAPTGTAHTTNLKRPRFDAASF